MVTCYFNGLTSGIWIDPNNQIMFWVYVGAAFAWTMFSADYLISIIPPLKIWKSTQGFDVEQILKDAAERREAERLCVEEEIGCDELNELKR